MLNIATAGRTFDDVDGMSLDALSLVSDSATLSPEQRERAQKTLAGQRKRIGRVSVTTVPSNAFRVIKCWPGLNGKDVIWSTEDRAFSRPSISKMPLTLVFIERVPCPDDGGAFDNLFAWHFANTLPA